MDNNTQQSLDIVEYLKELWNSWQIWVLVLCSLSLQFLLIFLAPLRKGRLSKWLSPLIWALYLLANSIAALALGNILNTQGASLKNFISEGENNSPICINFNNTNALLNKCNEDQHQSRLNPPSFDLMAFWAPFLLLHLGGPDTITSFSLEDNEFWLRHLLWLIFEVSIASLIIGRAIPWVYDLIFEDMLPMALIFLAGLIKYGERTRALYLASMHVFRNLTLKKSDAVPNYARLITSKKEVGVPMMVRERMEEEDPENSLATIKPLNNIEVVEVGHYFFKMFKGLIANAIFSFQEREFSQSFFLKLSAGDAFKVVDVELGFIYDVLYTKAAMVHSIIGYVLRGICSCLILVSFILFCWGGVSIYTPLEIGVTYAVGISTIVLDITSFIMLILSDWTIVSLIGMSARHKWTTIPVFILKKFTFLNGPRWSELISQYNLIDICLVKRCKFLNWILEKSGTTELLNYYMHTPRIPVTKKMKDFIFNELRRKSDFAKDDPKTIKKLCSRRGNWVLENTDCPVNELDWSIGEIEFDESLLLWHIATDLCYKIDTDKSVDNTQTDYMKISKNMADYMLYLLVVQHSMLSSIVGSELIRFQNTCTDAKKSLQREKLKLTPESAREMLLSKNDHVDKIWIDAIKLVKVLNEKLPGDRKWRIISEVWVEMLSYTASHCKEFSQAASLSKGGELLLFVRFLMAHLGLSDQFSAKEPS